MTAPLDRLYARRRAAEGVWDNQYLEVQRLQAQLREAKAKLKKPHGALRQ